MELVPEKRKWCYHPTMYRPLLNLTGMILALRYRRFALDGPSARVGIVAGNDVMSTGWLTWESAKKFLNSFSGNLNDLPPPS